MQTFHDYWLTSHSVDGQKAEISLRLSEDPRGFKKPHLIDLVFEGLIDYFLKHDLGVNIVYSIDEKPLKSFLDTNLEHFIEQAKWGWPKLWKGDLEKTRAYLLEHNSRVWEVETSYGLSGWVVAAQVRERALVA